jgi:hypothetical protein
MLQAELLPLRWKSTCKLSTLNYQPISSCGLRRKNISLNNYKKFIDVAEDGKPFSAVAESLRKRKYSRQTFVEVLKNWYLFSHLFSVLTLNLNVE